MRIILFLFGVFSALFAVGQTEKCYLVLTFNRIYQIDGYVHGTGDHVWIIPYDGSCDIICIDEMKPLFFEDYQINSLKDSITCEQSFGEFPVNEYSKQNQTAWILFKNRKEIQTHSIKYSHPKSKDILHIYCVPIIAKCSPQIKGKFNVMTFDSPPQLWNEFWERTPENSKILHYDFSKFEYLVTLKTNK